jgi:hypothetical protein
MKRMAIGALLCTFALSTAVDVAQAAPKKKASKAAHHDKAAPNSAEISKSMGDLKWGMDREELIKKFTDEVREKYKPLMAKATGAIEEDKLRGQMRNELGKIRSSVIEFNGTKTGWDASFLKSEFTHHNGESMFVVNDSNSQNYYFFFNSKLWKWYKAFNAEAFQGKKFDQFADALQGRFGKAASREGELSPGQGKQRWIEWQDNGSRLRAVDNNQFYGFYCMVFEDKKTLTHLADLRKNRPDSGQKGHALVDSVTTGEAGPNDGNPDIIDRITGKIRHRQDAPEPAAAGGRGAKPTASASSPTPPPAPSSPTVSEDDDPLKGLL